MSVRVSAAILFTLLGSPTLAVAGPIPFTLGACALNTPAEAPTLGLALVPVPPPEGGHTFDPAANAPVTFNVVAYAPWRIPMPEPRDVHADGTTHWNNEGYFNVDFTVTDAASGQSATVQLMGRAHLYNRYSTEGGWTGEAYFWFQDYASFVLNDQTYWIWGTNRYSNGPVTVDVWVGDGPPPMPQFTPEPGTFVLAALGLAPFGLRRVRRMW